MERYEFSYDRRGFPRILSGYPVDIEIENPPSGIPPSTSGEIGNVSSEGASLILNSSLPVSSIVTLRLDLPPDSSPIETKAQVMWSYFLARNKKFNCGVRFLDLGEKHREVLNKLIGEGMENNKSVPERRRSDRRVKTKELKERLWKAEMVLKKVKKTMDRRVVITGLGVIAPNGIGKEEFWKANLEGKSGVDLIRDFDVSLFNSKIAAQIKKIDPLDFVPKKVAKRVDRFVHLGLSSCKLAFIFLLDKDKGEYVLKSTSGIRRISLDKTLPEKENPIYIWFKKIVPLIIEKRFVRRRELDVLQREDIDFWLKEERLLRLDDYIKPALIELKKLMVELRAVLCVPSYYQEGLLGFLILGEKEKGLFRPQELSLFFRLARYAGLAIRSAQLSQDLQQAYTSVAQADRLSSMGQLAASFAHEINNPVAIIISGIELSLVNMREELLKAESLEEKEKVVQYTEDKLGKIKDEAFRISHIIDRIMGYVKAPMGDFTSVRLEDLIEATLGLVEHPLRKKQINVVKEIPKDLPKIQGIAGELQEVFLNLFNNALEAIEDETPGSINILARTLANPEMVEIKVSDTGDGISPENLRKIFDFLFTTKLQGTGVGLSVVYNIIKKHKGAIDVESEMGKGTTFTIRLPIWKEEGVIKR